MNEQMTGRRLRPGRPDGTSEKGRYVAVWVDEDTGRHEAQMTATSEQEVRDTLSPYVGAPVQVHRIGKVGT